MIVRNGVDVKTAADLGGWKDPSILLKRYAHSENLADVAERVFGNRSDTKLTRPASLKLMRRKKT
jgi:hypothetical protein